MDFLIGVLIFILGTALGGFLSLYDAGLPKEQAPKLHILAACILTGALCLLLYLRFGLFPALGFYMALFGILVAAAGSDILSRNIPSRLIAAGFAVGTAQLLAALLTDAFDPWHSYAIGFAAGGLPLLLVALAGRYIYKKDTIGGGDLKLMAFCGLVIGWRLVIVAYLIGTAAAALYAIGMLALKKKKRGDEIALAPFLSLGVALSVLAGDALVYPFLGL